MGLMTVVALPPTGVNVPFALSFGRPPSLSSVLPLAVSLTVTFTFPVLVILRLTPATTTGFGLCLVSMSFAFMLNPTSAELGNAVDRRGLKCYTAVYAVYNIAYSVGMMASNAVATAAGHLQFYQTLLCVSAVLIISLPLLFIGTPSVVPDPLANRKTEKSAKTI